jgi:hypothetical protein
LDLACAPHFLGGSNAPAPPSGYLWEHAARARLTYRLYGEFVNAQPPTVRPAPVTDALAGHVSPGYAGFDLSVTD